MERPIETAFVRLIRLHVEEDKPSRWFDSPMRLPARLKVATQEIVHQKLANRYTLVTNRTTFGQLGKVCPGDH